MKNTEKEYTELIDQVDKLPTVRKVRDAGRIMDSIKALPLDDKYSILVELKSLVAQETKEKHTTAEAELNKLKGMQDNL